jgi:CheY-like chemotaxis protein
VLTSEPRRLPSDNGTIPVGTVTHRAASGHRIYSMRQAMHTLYTRIADFLLRKDGSAAWPPSPEGYSSMRPIAVIGLLVGYEDRQLLAGICGRNRWRLLFADTCEEARTALDKLKAPLILCDRDLPGKGWRQTVEDLALLPHRACVILVSAVVDTYLRDEVVRHGGYDVLSKPLREDDVARAVRLASLYWYSATRTIADLIQES